MSCNLPDIGIPELPSIDDLFEFLLEGIPDLPTIPLPDIPCPLD